MISQGSSCTITHDIVIGEKVAFRAGEAVSVEDVAPNQQRPDFKYVVLSASLQRRFQLSEVDLQELQPAEPTPPRQAPYPPAVPPKPAVGSERRGLSSNGKAAVVIGVAILLIIVIAVAVEGTKTKTATTPATAGKQSTTVDTTAQDTTAQTEATTPETTPAPAPQPQLRTLQGGGNQATQTFNLQGGLVIFHMQGTSSENFAVELMDQASGEQAALLANVIGSYTGSQAVGVSAGTYLLNVTSTGPWSVGIEEPSPTLAPSTPQTFSGGGPMATGFFTPSNNLMTFTMSHQGSENFAVQVLDTDGNQVDLPANEIGPFQGSQAVSLDAGSIYILNVEANGSWTVQVQ